MFSPRKIWFIIIIKHEFEKVDNYTVMAGRGARVAKPKPVQIGDFAGDVEGGLL